MPTSSVMAVTIDSDPCPVPVMITRPTLIGAGTCAGYSNGCGVASGEGGVIHHRKVFPGDPPLRLWSGLIARRAGDFAAWREGSEGVVVFGLPARRIAGDSIP
jgi:hypothetical protein